MKNENEEIKIIASTVEYTVKIKKATKDTRNF